MDSPVSYVSASAQTVHESALHVNANFQNRKFRLRLGCRFRRILRAGCDFRKLKCAFKGAWWYVTGDSDYTGRPKAEILLDLLERYRPLFRGRILELGCGQGWASCLLKRLFPDAHITATDISPFAIASNPKWARVWGHSPDALYASNSYETREANQSVDLAFAFSAAHHFSDHAMTLAEIKRILRPGATAVYFYEPVCSSLLYPLALKRVNNKRPEVQEDLIVPANFMALAAAAGLSASFDYYPSTTKRGFVEMNYYKVLGWVPWLQRVLPATANIVIRA